MHFVEQPSGETQARTRFRDYDGRIRMVTKVGRSRAAAERALKTELTNRQALGGGSAITGSTRVTALADVWMEAEHGWSNGTQRTYRSVVNKQIKPAFGRDCSACRGDPDVAAGQFGEDVEGPAAVFGRGR